MGELGDLLELLHGGPRMQSMRATYDLWCDRERERRAFEAEMRHSSRMPAVADVVSFGFAEDSDGEPEECASIELWFESPARLREERFPPGAREPTSYGVRDGDSWWRFDRHLGAVHGSDEDEGGSTGEVGGDFELVLNPPPLVGPLTVEALGRGERAGRPVLRARARKRPDLNPVETMFHLRQLPSGADWYELEVDAERGVLLGLTATHGAKPFWSLAAAEVEFDMAIAPEVFQFSPPAGVELKALEDLFPDMRVAGARRIVVFLAAAAATFVLLVVVLFVAGG